MRKKDWVGLCFVSVAIVGCSPKVAAPDPRLAPLVQHQFTVDPGQVVECPIQVDKAGGHHYMVDCRGAVTIRVIGAAPGPALLDVTEKASPHTRTVDLSKGSYRFQVCNLDSKPVELTVTVYRPGRPGKTATDD